MGRIFLWDHLRCGSRCRGRRPLDHARGDRHRHRAIRLGPMVTPLARRRPVKVARETATLDRLSGGRLTLGVGLGSDRSGNELSITGEELDDRRRAGHARRGPGDPDGRLVGRTGAPPRRALHGRRHEFPAPAGSAAWGPGVGRGLQASQSRFGGPRGSRVSSPSASTTRNSSPSSSLASRRSAGGWQVRGSPTTSRQPPAGRRSGAVRDGRRDVVDGRVPVGCGIGRPGARCDRRRPGGPGVAQQRRGWGITLAG